jgi:diguanylate cyclase (GGDEF)-like protein
MSVYEDSSGTFWVGTTGGGLNRFDPDTGVFERIGDQTKGGLRSDVVWTAVESSDGSLWVGTQGGGLHRWRAADRREGRVNFEIYTERDGLANAFIYGILEDDDRRLWLSTNRGLSRFDPADESFQNFTPANGLQSFEFNFGAYHRADDGEMFFGGPNGLNYFHPSSLRQNDYVPPVQLTAVHGVEGPFPLAVLPWELTTMTLSHHDRVIAFEFAALDFTAPQRNKYAYMLEGFDDTWVNLETSRRATYTSLPPGRYTLRLRGSNSDGVWNEAGTSVAIRVLPAPWWSWWAWSIYALLVGTFVLWVVRAQRARLQREAEYSRKLEKQVQERTKELAEANAQLNEASLTDSLTGLRNRRYALTCVRDEMAGILREHLAAMHGTTDSEKCREALFIMIDLDGFKAVNDTYGHEAGDRVLLAVRDTLTDVCRASDTVVRWGGDEFLVVCRNTHRQGAKVIAEKLRSEVAALDIRLENGEQARIGCSIGYAFYPFLPEQPRRVDWERVQIAADAAMYVAKRSGRNRWVGFCHDGVSPALGSQDEPDLTLPPELAEIEGMRLIRSAERVDTDVLVPNTPRR